MAKKMSWRSLLGLGGAPKEGAAAEAAESQARAPEPASAAQSLPPPDEPSPREEIAPDAAPTPGAEVVSPAETGSLSSPGWPVFPNDPVVPLPLKVGVEADEQAPPPAAADEPEPEPPLPPREPPPDAEPFLTRSELEAELRDLRSELAWLRGALDRQIDAKQRLEEEVRLLSDHDPLTGVASARRFADRLGVAVVHAQRYKQKLAVLQLGLDRFAGINERLGRQVGDDLLKSIAVALETTLRQGDTVGRVGGDEFTILLPGIKKDEDIGVIVDKLRLTLRSPFSIGGHDLLVTASMGVALFPDDGPDTETLLQSAQVALQRAKARGGDTWDVHAPTTSALAAERLARETALRKALVEGELALFYQPIVDCEKGTIVGVEALLRWRNPERMMSAAEFVPLADVTGLAVPLGQWALRTACQQAKAWRDAGYRGLVVAVNMSSRQLRHPSLVKLVKRVLDETGLPAKYLEIELSEPELARNPEVSITRLTELKELGIRLAIDDFGTGDSALTHLYRYPVDSLKIDGSIVQEMATDKDKEAVATAALTLARARNLKVVAEGVETEAQRIRLINWQCDRMQGNLCGPPSSASDLEKLLIRQKRAARELAEQPDQRTDQRTDRS
jgi:diguanylate cyclase (GGDEF)-like protein